jgi:ribonucleoside-diphosphate reductase subunit M2
MADKSFDADEEILTETSNRFVLFPIKYPDIYRMYKTALSAFWVVEEIDFSKDIHDWENKLNDNERYFIENVLAFFAASDGIVDENLFARFYQDIKVPEARCFLSLQGMMESIHSETYSLMIDTYIKDQKKRETLFDAMHKIPAVKKKADWAIKWMEDQDASFAQRIVAFAVVEGLSFQASFAAIYWLKERNLMPGLAASNNRISIDESTHSEFSILLYSKLKHKLDEETVHNIIKEATEIELEFITESIPCSMIGMNNDLMGQYVKFVADRIAVQLGYSTIYGTSNPFPFMERLGMESKMNFFEERNLDYVKAKVGKKDVYKFATDADF